MSRTFGVEASRMRYSIHAAACISNVSHFGTTVINSHNTIIKHRDTVINSHMLFQFLTNVSGKTFILCFSLEKHSHMPNTFIIECLALWALKPLGCDTVFMPRKNPQRALRLIHSSKIEKYYRLLMCSYVFL